MPIVTTSNRGQIVIPKEVRKRLKLIPGKKLLIKVEGDHAILLPLPDNPVDYYCGFFSGDASLTEALLEEREKDRDREAEKVAG
jgi:AbrB family looped-hinge helix DNA binding protein